MSRFKGQSDYRSERTYRFLPFRFRRPRNLAGEVIVTNAVGEHVILEETIFGALANKTLDPSSEVYSDLLSAHFIAPTGAPVPLDLLALKYRTKKAHVFAGPALHIFVVTLRCNHSCSYCQVSRRLQSEEAGFDMSLATAEAAVGHVLRSPAREITVEFQGGEPLLAFPLIRFVVERLVAADSSKRIRFVIASTLHHLNPEILEFTKVHGIQLSTSLDGPADLHNRNRPTPTRDSFQRTLQGIQLARASLGDDAVAALTTLTRRSLADPAGVIDSYRELGFRSIFLRTLSPYGFAESSRQSLTYSVDDFLAFYRSALDHLIRVNLDGYRMEEVYTTLLLRSILTPFSHGYTDLRSPAGAGLGVLVYNYNGKVYPTDEARMLVEMGDDVFCMGDVTDAYETLMDSPAMQMILSAAVAESIPGCSDCAYLPYCGSDPVDSYARQQDLVGHRPSSPFCRKQLGILDHIFWLLHHGGDETRRVLESWVWNSTPQAF